MPSEGPHGGAIDRMRRLFPAAQTPWIDLSTGINPWPYRVAETDPAMFDQLPTQSEYNACRNAMAKAIGAPRDSICLAPGSELLIRLLPQFISPKRVVILTPTYGDHLDVWRKAPCRVIETDTPLAQIDQSDAVIVCNPNNPNGQIFQPERLREAHAKLAEKSGWLIIDEAYADLSPDLSLARQGGEDGLIILRSFGKFYGLAGLRLGALVAPPWLLARMTEQLGVWPVSSGALKIGAEAYADRAWQESTRTTLKHMRRLLDEVLSAHKLEIVGGTDLFCLVCVEHAPEIWRGLAEAGIYVRRFDSLPEHLRIGLPKGENQLARLNEALSLLA
ncbi:MAG: threonine-phosphate decarboxylase [Henriciella sp.]|nr:threonine-phosphate decarboxylase [Henriciella sp.]